MKTILITGANGGIGAAMVDKFAAHGWRMAASMRKPVEDPRENVSTIQMDITDPSAVRAGIETLVSEWGSLELVVNNAGYGNIVALLEETTDQEVRRQMETNFFGGLNVCREVLPHMRRAGRGRIVNVTSIAASLGLPYYVSYCASKFALKGFTLAIAEELESHGVYATAFEPGAIKAGAAFNSRCERGRPQSDLDADYEAMVSRFEAALELYQSSWATEPEVVANRLYKLANMRRPPTTCYASYDATLLNTVKRLLSERLFRKLVQLAR